MTDRKPDIRIVSLVLVLLTACSLPLAGQAEEDAAWIWFERGRTSYDNREYGIALQDFRRAIQIQGAYPEAEAAIGDIYLAEGELRLAERQYLRAIDQRSSLYVSDEYYSILYRLASLYSLNSDYFRQKRTLERIVEADETYTSAELVSYRRNLIRVFVSEGADRFLLLYRFEDPMTLQAHTELGILLVRQGLYEDALPHLAFALDMAFTRLIGELMNRAPEYEYEGLAQTLSFALRRGGSPLTDFMNSVELYRLIYYTGSALYGASNIARAIELWRLISTLPGAGEWGLRAARQLQRPYLEPLINVE